MDADELISSEARTGAYYIDKSGFFFFFLYYRSYDLTVNIAAVNLTRNEPVRWTRTEYKSRGT